MASWSRHPGPGQRYRHGWIPIGEVGDFRRGSRGGTFQAAHRQAQRTGNPALIKGKTRDFKVEASGQVHARSARGGPVRGGGAGGGIENLATPGYKPSKAKTQIGVNPLAAKTPSQRGPGLAKKAQRTSSQPPFRKKSGATRDVNFGERRPGTETVGAPKTNPKNVGQNIGKPGALSKPEPKRKMAPKDNVVRSQEALNKARATAKKSGKSVYVTPGDFKLSGNRPKGPHVEITPDGKKILRRNG